MIAILEKIEGKEFNFKNKEKKDTVLLFKNI
jgi:hypothetical protein